MSTCRAMCEAKVPGSSRLLPNLPRRQNVFTFSYIIRPKFLTNGERSSRLNESFPLFRVQRIGGPMVSLDRKAGRGRSGHSPRRCFATTENVASTKGRIRYEDARCDVGVGSARGHGRRSWRRKPHLCRGSQINAGDGSGFREDRPAAERLGGGHPKRECVGSVLLGASVQWKAVP